MGKLDQYSLKKKPQKTKQEKKEDEELLKIPIDAVRARRWLDDPCFRPC
jgi:hypothetical protein